MDDDAITSLNALIEEYDEVRYWDDTDAERLVVLNRALNSAVSAGVITDSEADDVEHRFVSTVEHERQTT